MSKSRNGTGLSDKVTLRRSVRFSPEDKGRNYGKTKTTFAKPKQEKMPKLETSFGLTGRTGRS